MCTYAPTLPNFVSGASPPSTPAPSFSPEAAAASAALAAARRSRLPCPFSFLAAGALPVGVLPSTSSVDGTCVVRFWRQSVAKMWVRQAISNGGKHSVVDNTLQGQGTLTTTRCKHHGLRNQGETNDKNKPIPQKKDVAPPEALTALDISDFECLPRQHDMCLGRGCRGLVLFIVVPS